jgi:hypothetical protein
MRADVDSARRDWEDGYRRMAADAADSAVAERLHRQLDAITAELRKRIGATFTLAELADAYADSDRWVREAVEERAPVAGWPRTVSVVGDAAFHLYARGAVDYVP